MSKVKQQGKSKERKTKSKENRATPSHTQESYKNNKQETIIPMQRTW